MKRYGTFRKAPGLEPHHQMQFSVKHRTLVYSANSTAQIDKTGRKEMCSCVCVCVCNYEREREGEGGRERVINTNTAGEKR